MQSWQMPLCDRLWSGLYGPLWIPQLAPHHKSLGTQPGRLDAGEGARQGVETVLLDLRGLRYRRQVPRCMRPTQRHTDRGTQLEPEPHVWRLCASLHLACRKHRAKPLTADQHHPQLDHVFVSACRGLTEQYCAAGGRKLVLRYLLRRAWQPLLRQQLEPAVL